VRKLLGTCPPDINPEEKQLPRITLQTLSQVRSTYCDRLKSYQSRIGSASDDLCPACRGPSHTTKHFFSCPSIPTDLTIHDLWTHPRAASDSLQSVPSFSHLPSNLPPRRPPPEPPPIAQAAWTDATLVNQPANLLTF
jgi:hypothetical protein